jgi:hypothetical protein
MTIFEETDELLFVQHATHILGVPNSRPDLEPGGLWIRGKIRLSWGLRTATEPPTIQLGRTSAALNGNIAALPYDLTGRLAVWRTAFSNRENSTYPDLSNLDFRDVVALTAILSWNPPEPPNDDDD